MSRHSGPRRRAQADSSSEQLPRRAHRCDALRGGAPSEDFQNMVKVFRYEMFFICGLHWNDPELGKYVKYFYSKMFSTSQLDSCFLNEDIASHLKLAQLVATSGLPHAAHDIDWLFNEFFNKVDYKVHSHKYSKGGWEKADIWFHVIFSDDMQSMASNNHATPITVRQDSMPVAFYVTVDPNDPNDTYHYILEVAYDKSEAGPNKEVLANFTCTKGTRSKVSEDGDMGPPEECQIDPLAVTVSMKWQGPSDRFKKKLIG